MVPVLLIDSEDVVRRGFRQALGELPEVRVLADVRAGAHAVAAVDRYRPRVVLVDPGRDADLVRGLCTRAAVVVLTSQDQDEDLFRAVQAGARGFLLKSVGLDELGFAVRAVAAGHSFVCPEMTRRLLDRFDIRPPPEDVPLAALSTRERQVLVRIAEGRSNLEIAHELYLTTATVKSHVSRILAKLGLPNRMQAALLAHRVGLVHTPPIAG